VPQEPTKPDIAEYARLLSLAVHELRTPASVVGGYLRMLQSDASGPTTEHQRRMIDEAGKSCERLVAIIGELGEIARLDRHETPVAQTRIDIFQLVREAAVTVRTAEGRAAICRFLGASSGASCRGDAARLGAAFSSLLTAIAREQGDPATLTIDCRIVEGDGARTAVVLAARGDDADDLFERPRRAFDEGRGGMGLSLPIARRVVEAHGGRVWSPVSRGNDDPSRHSAVAISIPIT
jgi:signal transduction histidine kinase